MSRRRQEGRAGPSAVPGDRPGAWRSRGRTNDAHDRTDAPTDELAGLSTSKRMNRIAATDVTFSRRGGEWVGRCLICGGPLRFDVETGEGANVEHIVPRSLGGTNDLRNLGITHPRCNGEKGRRWDPKRRHRANRDRYEAIVNRLLAERARRWRDIEAQRSAADEDDQSGDGAERDGVDPEEREGPDE